MWTSAEAALGRLQAHPQARERRIRRKRVLSVQLSSNMAVAVGRAHTAAAARRPIAAVGRATLAERAGAPALARLPRLKVLRILREGGARAQLSMRRAPCARRTHDVCSRQPCTTFHKCKSLRPQHTAASPRSQRKQLGYKRSSRLAVSQDSVAGPHTRLRAPCLRSRRPGRCGPAAREPTGGLNLQAGRPVAGPCPDPDTYTLTYPAPPLQVALVQLARVRQRVAALTPTSNMTLTLHALAQPALLRAAAARPAPARPARPAGAPGGPGPARPRASGSRPGPAAGACRSQTRGPARPPRCPASAALRGARGR
jgi:hypothetical protein